MRRCYIKNAAAFSVLLLLSAGVPALSGCVTETAVIPTVGVTDAEEEVNFATRGSSVSMVVETVHNLFFKYKNDLWELDKTTDQMELLYSTSEEDSSGPFWVYNNNLYFTVTVRPLYSADTKCVLYKMNLDTKEKEELVTLSAVPSGIYASDGLLYVEGYNLRSIYKLSEQGTLEHEVSESDTIYGLIPEGCTVLNGDFLPYLVGQNGYMPLSNGENLVIADKDGKNARSVPGVPDGGRMIFSEEAVYVSQQAEKGYICQRIDIKTLEATTLFETENYPALLQYRGGSLYYMDNGSLSMIGSDATFYGVDTKTGERRTVATLEQKPGAGGFYDYYGNFYVTENMIYKEHIVDYGVFMMRNGITEGAGPVTLETPLYQSELKKLGNVEAESVKTPCFCGEKTAAEVYVERLVLKGTSDAVAKINETLSKSFEQQRAYSPAFSDVDEAIIHEETFTPYALTSQVADIHYLDDRYLCLQMNGYEYTGGAHGMPYRDIYLFDLQTGERLALKDIVDISEEELKTQVSACFKELSEKTGFSFLSPEDLEREVWDSVTLDSPFYLTKEGLVFYYQPYEIAAYVVGFPEVTIPYSGLKMKIQLQNAAAN